MHQNFDRLLRAIPQFSQFLPNFGREACLWHRKPVPDLIQHFFGKVFADKGYISQKMFEELMESFGVQVVTKLKRNMKQRLMPLSDRLLLRKRAVIETVIDPFSSKLLGEHSVWLDCLLSSTQKARNYYGKQLALFCLTRTHVKLIDRPYRDY
jgi:hypothetical protein